MKRLFLTCLALLAMLSSHAIDFDCSNNGTLAAGIKLGSSLYPSFDAEIDLEYRPFRYIGANAGLLLIMPINRSDDVVKELPVLDNVERELINYKQTSYGTAAKAGLQFTTPAVMLSKGEMGLSLRLSPGILMPFPTNKRVRIIATETITEIYEDVEYSYSEKHDEYYDNSGAKFCYWYGRAELVLEYEENWEFNIGYTYSNFDLYGGSRSIEINGTPIVVANKKPMQNFMLGFTYKF
ncbi:MAG: hypothetical protein J5629_08365 [Muribaculaceae bacterium]|nr:hypothetical protein [Muribaculaceae bacterium]